MSAANYDMITFGGGLSGSAWRIKSEYVSVTRCGSTHLHCVLL
jgi:hypothetical protein